MFGLALSRRLIQGPAIRSWNSITGFANLLWCKFNHSRNSIMPRSRRRYHSRSRSRSRSHSYDRDRDLKRRRIDSGENSPYRRSLSPEDYVEEMVNEESNTESSIRNEERINESLSTPNHDLPMLLDCKVMLTDCVNLVENYTTVKENEPLEHDNSELNSSIDSEISGESGECSHSEPSTSLTALSTIKVTKSFTPKHSKKQLERQKLREAKLAELELKKRQMLEAKLKLKNEKERERAEKQRIKQEKEEQKLKEKLEKQELKQKELEEKQKEKELKDEKKKKELEEREQKRKEKEEKDELRRKEKEEKDEQKRKELEEKIKEKQKQEEKKQKVAAMFVNFFTKKSDPVVKKKCDELVNTNFMPFKVRADMRVAPLCRKTLTETEKSNFTNLLHNGSTKLYLDELKGEKIIGKAGKTWPFEEVFENDVIIVEDTNIGESIEDIPKTKKFRAKFFKFEENRRPPYFGTWQKRSTVVRPRNPLGLDKEFFDYDVDSDDEWEEEDPAGESLCGSDDEDKENDAENEYEVDDDFFVPHGYLSDDEMNDEEITVVSPESHKEKLKLLKKEFEEEMKDQTHKIKPRVIGCFWEKKLQDTEDDDVYNFLKPFSIISNGPVFIKKRSKLISYVPLRKSGIPGKPISAELIPRLLKFIHGSTKNMKSIINDFLSDLTNKGINTEVSKNSLRNELRHFAEWMRYPESGSMHNKFCWYVHKEMQEKYNLDLSVPS